MEEIMKVLYVPNALSLPKEVNSLGIKKEQIVSVLPVNGQVALIYYGK